MWRFFSCLLRLVLLAGSLLFSGMVMAEPAWQLSLERDGIRVWKRPEAGSAVTAFRAETSVTSSLSGLLNLFYDLEHVPQWLDSTHRVVALQRNDLRHQYIMLIETDLPWPLASRDAVIAGHWWQNPVTKAVYMRGKGMPKGSYPENPDYLRYYDLRSDWTFVPEGNGRVRIIMEGHADPAGNLPAWAINLLIQESPFRTLGNMRNVIGAEHYQGPHFDGIDEPSPNP